MRKPTFALIYIVFCHVPLFTLLLWMSGMLTLITLPVELLYEIQLFATSNTLPQTCKSLHQIFMSSPTSYRAQYLFECVKTSHARPGDDIVLTKIFRYPICTQPVLEAYFRLRACKGQKHPSPELPRRLFRTLVHKSEWSDKDAPMPFLRYLYSSPWWSPPDANSHDGYALTKAVQVGFVPLVQFLLEQGATPARKSNLPILIAIHRKDLSLVRMLVERKDNGVSDSSAKVKGKRRKLEDRVEVTLEMLKAAVKCKAQDIVEYLTKEKGCIPDMQTLLLMR